MHLHNCAFEVVYQWVMPCCSSLGNKNSANCLGQVCQEMGIPVILDEVFTGFWRLGALTASELLGVHPDIACFAKLLTGGMVPMAVTVTGKAAFKAFWGKYKVRSTCCLSHIMLLPACMVNWNISITVDLRAYCFYVAVDMKMLLQFKVLA